MDNLEEKLINLVKELSEKDKETVIIFIEYLIYKNKKAKN